MLAFMFLQPVAGKSKQGTLGAQGTLVTDVDLTSNTVTLTLKETKQGTDQVIVYAIGLGAAITIDGLSASLAQVHKGMRVLGYTEGDEHTLIALDVEK